METATVNQELYLAAALMARPEFVPALFPPSLNGDGDLRVIANRVARAVISILATQGPAFANPSAMSAALADVPVELDADEVIALMALIPAPFEVELAGLAQIKEQLSRAVNQKELAQNLILAGTKLRQGNDESVADAQDAIARFQRGNVGKDPTAKGVLSRIGAGQTTIRWKVGCPLLDELVPGVGPNGEMSCGIAGQGEVVTIAARYGVGKTRLLLNWLGVLLDEGASIGLIVLEDGEQQYALKLIGARFGIRKWELEHYAISRPTFLTKYGQEHARKMEEALGWYENLGSRIRIYDGSAKVNVFKFHSMMGLLEEDKALYNTTHVGLDYAQAVLKGELNVIEAGVQDLRAFAGRTNTGLFLLSQVSNETMKFGAAPGMVPTKGTSEIGQISHFGYLLETDPIVGQREVKIVQSKGRDAGSTVLYAQFDVETGRVERYVGTPMWFPLPEDPSRPAKKGGRK